MSNTEQSEIYSPKRSNILQTADSIINGTRQNDYGPPEENFGRIADFWSTYLKKHLNIVLTPRHIAEMMILLKVARLIQSPTDDTYIDIAGYAGLAGELSDRETEVPDTFGQANNIVINIEPDINLTEDKILEIVKNALIDFNSQERFGDSQ